MGTFFGLIAVLFAVLQIILFFKIWGMTNDIREIKEKYLSSTDPKKSVSPAQPTEFSIGASHEGDFTASEIKHFNS